MLYYRLCKGLHDVGTLCPEDVPLGRYILSRDDDYYRSIFFYNEEQKKLAEEIIKVQKNGFETIRPRGISGITDVLTNRLVFDFDSENDIQIAKLDAIELVSRLTSMGVGPDYIQIYFSGKKGFAVEVNSSETFTPLNLKNVILNLAGDLSTIDKKIYKQNNSSPFNEAPEGCV